MKNNKLTPFFPEIFKKYNEGLTTQKLADIYLCNVKTIYSLFKQNNVQVKTLSDYRKYEINHNYFEIINSEEKAYFLGLMYADGYNNEKKGFASISLSEKDKEILNIFTENVQPLKPLMFTKKKKDTFSNFYTLTMHSRKITTNLSKLGCKQAKTHILQFPTEEQIPSYLLRHFVRGYFDGDGCINNGKRNHFSFVGTKDFINSLQELFKKELNFNITKTSIRHPLHNNNTVTLLKCGKIQSIKFGEWLYKDATIYMKRKKDIFESYKLK